jgi:hypothetical protein
MPERRQLSFACLDEVMPEVESLLGGYDAVGQWSLGQICKHLSLTLTLIVDRAPDNPSANSPEDPRFARIRERFFRAGRFPDGVPAPIAEVLPCGDLDDRAEAEALQDALVRFQSAAGPFARHPFLGTMTKEEWIQFHRLHAAHHLGFVVPSDCG